MTIPDRVQRGAAYLDDIAPGWPDRIDTLKLDIGSPCRCILGQLYGDYFDAPLVTDAWAEDTEDDPTYDRGFCGTHSEHDALTIAWRQLITERQTKP